MQKTILITGSTDGIGLETAKMLMSKGHNVLLHGRNPSKLEKVAQELGEEFGVQVETYLGDLSRLPEVVEMAEAIARNNNKLDVLINNAGVFVAPEITTGDGFDIRFVVNTIAPYLLTTTLLGIMDSSGRVINLSSAAQAPVSPEELIAKRGQFSAGMAYAQSKLALTMWSRDMALSLGDSGPAVIAINPKSMLGSKMVQEAYGTSGVDLRIGAEILCRAALDIEFSDASGQYFDNDIGEFSHPHPDALDPQKCRAIVVAMETILTQFK